MTGEQQIPETLADEWAWNAAGRLIPRSVDVAIIGGGIVGCSAAYFLARQGVAVALFEKGRIAGEHEVQRASETVDVGPGVDLVAVDGLLRGQVVDGADHFLIVGHRQ